MFNFRYSAELAGYTLAEQLAVTSILGTLAAIFLPVSMNFVSKARLRADVSNMRSLIASERYEEANEAWEKIMLSVGDDDENGTLSNKEFLRLPCDKLRMIDGPWSLVQGGMSKQKQIFFQIFNRYQRQGQAYHKVYMPDFYTTIGWRNESEGLRLMYRYDNLGGLAEITPGNLPRAYMIKEISDTDWHPDHRLGQCGM